MKNPVSEITRNSDNLELISSLIASVGMIMLMINIVLGKVIIILGISALAITYLVQCVPLLNRNNKNRNVSELTLYHMSSIVLLTGILLTMTKSHYDIFVLSVGWLLTGICLMINLLGRKKQENRQPDAIQLRFLVLTVISIIFYAGF
jgi:hypothetical protein